MSALCKVGQFTSEVFAKFRPISAREISRFLPKEQQVTDQSLDLATGCAGAQSELSRSELDANRSGATLTDDQDALSSFAVNAAIESGLSDISRFHDESLESLAQETAPGRGLRPSDAPIVDVGVRIVNESSRLASRLVNDVPSQEFGARLNFPSVAGQAQVQHTEAQQQLAAGTTGFN